MVLLEIGFIACGVEAYFPAAYNLKAFVFGLAFYQLMGLFKEKKKKRNEERQSMHQNNRIISWIISFLFSICMVISISYDQRDNWSLIICDKKHMISALIMTMILTMIVHMIMNVLYSKAGSLL